MGLAFHYSGSFDKSASLSAMIEEVKDISAVNKWQYTVFEQSFPSHSFDTENYDQKIYGICFSPSEGEPVWLCFLSNGKMSSPPNLQFFGITDAPGDRERLYMLSTKTQYAGVEVHQRIIDLLRYLRPRYFSDLKVSDEGQYWETGDKGLLKETFKRYDTALQIVGTALENNSILPGETFEEYFQRVFKDGKN